MNRPTDKYQRPDYDYYEDSLGDAYGDYDELDAESSDNRESDSDGTGTNKDEIAVLTAPKKNSKKDDNDSEAIPYPTDAEYGAEISFENTDGKYKYTQQDLVELMDLYHHGTEDDRKYVGNQFCIMLTPMIRSMIRHTRGIDSEYLDYIQHCYMYVIKRLNRFDPTKSFVFSYFKYVIQEGITSCNEDSHGKTSHSTNIDRKVKKVLRKYESMNITPSPSQIAGQTGLSVPQVEDSLSRINAEKLVLIEDFSSMDDQPSTGSPLDVLLKGEVSETLKNAIDQLPERERIVISLSYNLDNSTEKFTAKKIAQILHTNEAKVKELLISAKRHLKRDFSLDQLLGKSKRISQREYGIYANDPVHYSFDPDCDEYQFLAYEEDVTVNSEEDQQILPAKKIKMIDRISSITFETY